MNSEIRESTFVTRTIYKLLSEENCIHNIREIMQEALDSKSGLGNPTPNPVDADINNPEVEQGNVYKAR